MNDYFAQIGVWPKGAKRLGLRYVIGFVLSILLTAAAYYLTVHQMLSQQTLFIVVLILALIQVVVQLECFLHLGSDLSMRIRLLALSIAVIIIAILVGGSVWIMYNLNQRMMPSMQQMEQYMNEQGGF